MRNMNVQIVINSLVSFSNHLDIMPWVLDYLDINCNTLLRCLSSLTYCSG